MGVGEDLNNTTQAPNTSIYNGVHGYITTPICILGIIFNILCIIGWMKVPRRTPANFVLMILSIVDFFVVLSYLPIAVYIFLLHGDSSSYCDSKSSIYLILISNHLFILTSAWSNWIAVKLATIRFINVATSNTFRLSSVKKTVLIFTFIYLLEASIYFFYYEVAEAPTCGYWIGKTKLASTSTGYQTIVTIMVFLTRGIIPAVMFLTLCFLTLYVVIHNRHNTRLFDTYSENSRITAMLLVVGVLFFLTMMPVTLYPFTMFLRPMSKVEYFWFLDNNYQNFNVNVLTLPQLFNCSFNIIIYVTMSSDFRRSLCCLSARRRENYIALDNAQNYQQMQVAVKNCMF